MMLNRTRRSNLKTEGKAEIQMQRKKKGQQNNAEQNKDGQIMKRSGGKQGGCGEAVCFMALRNRGVARCVSSVESIKI
jgi:hypothetical protein